MKNPTKKPKTTTRFYALSADGQSVRLDRYVQFFIGAISNRLLRVSSKVYPSQFGVSSNEWRVLAMLANESDITATRICEVIGFDKAAVSRSLRLLEDDGYVITRPVETHNRARRIALTASGRRLHAEIMDVALRREDRLLQDISPAEREHLLRNLQIMYRNAVQILAETERAKSEADRKSGH